jgi:hypothetical protein
METQILLSTRPNNAFTIGAGPGNVYSGGAAAFQPQQDCSLTSVALLLQGYTGANGQQINVELWSNTIVGEMNRPGGNQLGTFNVPNPNAGAVAEFLFNLPTPVNLTVGNIYWILIYGVINAVITPKVLPLYWLAGGNAVGDASYVQSLLFAAGNYQSSVTVPAFTVNVAV